MRVLVEGNGPDALALARLLEAEGHEVRLGLPAELDADPGWAEIAYLDPWTPETALRIQRLRAQGTRLSCLGDLLLERWQGPTIGITGTAGKTTTTALTAAVLRRAGIDAAVSRGARAGNLWPTGDLLDELAAGGTAERTLLLELTSSHLAFMRHSPRIAAVVSFWPDHLELHGGLDRYRAAKETIVRHQRAGDLVVVGDGAAADFASLTPAKRIDVSLLRPVVRGAYLDGSRGVVLASDGVEVVLGHLERGVAHPLNVVAAAAIATAAGALAEAVVEGIGGAQPPPWRAQPAGTLAGVPVIDDGMAATPAKTAALLALQPAASVVLIAGGLTEAGGEQVHSAPAELELLERACDEIARVARAVVVFGESGSRLAALLRSRGLTPVEVNELPEAVAAAARLAPGAARVFFSPLFPIALEDRARFAELIEAAS